MVDSIVTLLEQSDKLDNTYIIYTSDNGYHIGQHRLPPGKTCGFEEDIRVPFIVRGPGVARGQVQRTVSTHIDIAPTLFQLAGIPLRQDFDGTPIPVKDTFSNTSHEHVTVEFWGNGVGEGTFGGFGESDARLLEQMLTYLTGPGGSIMIPNNTYKSVRIMGEGYNLYYSVWCSNEHELYDVSVRLALFHQVNLCSQ